MILLFCKYLTTFIMMARFTIILFMVIALGCAKEDPQPEPQVCIEGEYKNEEGAVYYVTCPPANATVCERIFKFVIEVKGYNSNTPGKIVIRALTATTVTKTERIVGMHGQKFQMKTYHDITVPTTYRVTFELPPGNCTVNGEPDFYTYVIDTPCGTQSDLKYDIECITSS